MVLETSTIYAKSIEESVFIIIRDRNLQKKQIKSTDMAVEHNAIARQ